MASASSVKGIWQRWAKREVAVFHGQRDTRIATGEDYETRTLGEIFVMSPGEADKGESLACIPSSYHDFDARNHAAQRERGIYVALTADIDSGDHPIERVKGAVQAFVGDCAWMVYSSAHARPGDMRWRVIIPLDVPTNFETWHDAQNALFNDLEYSGIEVDRAMDRAGQPVFLPNVPLTHAKTGEQLRDEFEPLYYQRATSGLKALGLKLDDGRVATGIDAIRRKRDEDEKERARIRKEIEAKRAARPVNDGAPIMSDFNAGNSIASLLELYGYKQSPRNSDDWRSPHQTGESYATRIIGDKWVSLSMSDASARLGDTCSTGCYGDAYDLFVHYEHGGDHKAAFRALYAERRAATPQTYAAPPMPDPDDPGPSEEWCEGPGDPVEVAEASAEEAEGIVGSDDDLFPLFNPAELEAMPPPRWLVDGTIGEDSLSILYGEPGSFKSFVALDMAIRIATGADWHGAKVKQAGVIYIAGEGVRGIGKRIAGWRRHHRITSIDAPLFVLPTAVQVLDKPQRAKLIRTIQAAMDDAGIEIGLVVIDTVSRSIAGVDENTQDTMTQFVDACDEIRRAAGGALLGIHHSGKDKDKGMRGSSVLLGAVDASLRLSKSERVVTMQTEKQKDAEQSQPIYFQMEPVAWEAGEETISTLVPVRSNMDAAEGISMAMIRRAFGILADAWTAKKPLSNAPQTRREGRFAPRVFASQIGGEADAWGVLIEAWLMNGNVEIQEADRHSKAKGLAVIDPIV